MTDTTLTSSLDGLIVENANHSFFLYFVVSFSLFLAIVFFVLFFSFTKKRKARYRAQAQDKLDELTLLENDKEFLRELNQILKDTARTSFTPKVSTLTGEKWLKFLNLTSPEYLFTPRELELFGEIYNNNPISLNRQELLIKCRKWVQTHKKIKAKKLQHLYV